MVQIVRRNQVHPFDELRSEMDRLFGGLISAPAGFVARGPRIDVELVETEAAFVVRAEVPGIDPDQLEVSVTGDRLVLAGEKVDPLAGDGEGRRYSERCFGAVRREIELPVDVDPSAVTAQHAHGVLTVTLPKAGTHRPKRVEIQKS